MQKDTFSYSILDLIPESEVFESLFLKVQNKRDSSLKYVIGNVYRPPHDMVSKLDQFINLILQTFEELNYRAYICGDYNIDLLQMKIQTKSIYFTKT